MKRLTPEELFPDKDDLQRYGTIFFWILQIIEFNESIMKELEIFENRYERLDNFSRVAPSRRNIPVKRHNAIVVKMDKAAQQFVTVCEMVMNEAQHFKTLKDFNDIFSEIMKRKKPKPANFHKLIEANLPAIDAINTKKDKIEKALQHMIVLLEEAEREMKKELS